MDTKTETVTISKANALKAYKAAPTDFKPTLETLLGKNVVFEKITDRVQSWEDVCELKGIDPVQSLPYPNATTTHQHYINAHHVLAIGIEVLNEEWVADYTNDNQPKYMPRFEHKSGVGLSLHDDVFWDSYSYCGPRLDYRSPEILYHGVQIFFKQYEIIHSH